MIFRGDLSAALRLEIGRGEVIYFFGCVAHALYAPLVRKLNHDPIMFLKGDGMAREGAASRISTVRRIFNLDKNVCTCSGKN